MPNTVTWSDSATFSNGTDGTSSVLTIPSLTAPDTYGATVDLFVAIAGKGGTSTFAANEHQFTVSGSAISPSRVSTRTHLNGGTDEYHNFMSFQSFAAGELDAGATLSIKTFGATANPPEIGLCMGAIVSWAHEDATFHTFSSGGDQDFNGSTTPTIAWGGPNQGSFHVIPRGIMGFTVGFVHSPDPPAEPAFDDARWVEVLFDKTTDGRGLGQALIKFAFWTPTEVEMSTDTVALPFPVAVVNLPNIPSDDSNGVMTVGGTMFLDFYPAAGGAGRAWAVVIG